jgi:hypothetical protein
MEWAARMNLVAPGDWLGFAVLVIYALSVLIVLISGLWNSKKADIGLLVGSLVPVLNSLLAVCILVCLLEKKGR